jgi:hypothetical protein
LLLTHITACGALILAGGHFTISPASGTPFFVDNNGAASSRLTGTSGGSGIAGLASVDPGTVTINATAPNTTFHPIAVQSIADTVTEVFPIAIP